MPLGVRRATPSSFSAVAELAGKSDVGGTHLVDARHGDAVEVGHGAEGKAGQQRQLMGGVAAADVERGIGFGITQALRLGENLRKGPA